MSAMPKLGISLEKTNFFEIDWAYAAFWHTAFLILQQTSNQKKNNQYERFDEEFGYQGSMP